MPKKTAGTAVSLALCAVAAAAALISPDLGERAALLGLLTRYPADAGSALWRLLYKSETGGLAPGLSVPVWAPDSAEALDGSSTVIDAYPASGADAIPVEDRGEIKEVTYTNGTGARYFYCDGGCFLNKTAIAADEAASEAEKAAAFEIELDSDEPQVLIYHTHATECYDRYDAGYYDINYPTRSTDDSINMVSVGDIVADRLNELGICTVHCDTQHDYPAYNGAYTRSRASISEYLKEYPSIKVVLDLHRDAVESDGVRTKAVTVVNGRKAAQMMIICGADDGTMNMPNYLCNLRFAAKIQSAGEKLYPGLMRPAMFDYRDYNQGISTGALLIEIGTHANSLDEAQYSGELLADVLAEALK